MTLTTAFSSILLSTTPVVSSGLQTSPIDLVLQSGFVAKMVLLALIFASFLSWTVILVKHWILKNAHKESKQFLNTFWYGQDLEEIFSKSEKYTRSPVANVFKAGFKELKKISEIDGKIETMRSDALTNISRTLTRATLSEIGTLEKKVGLLATVASSTPFIGLFGTVWGIMNSFQGIGASGSANLAAVAPGISEALITTAAGLGAAIPAVIAYNYFVGRIKTMATEIDMFSQDFLNIVQRSFLKAQ